MNPAERLAHIVSALEGAGVKCLVMGGHACRYYGIDRNTNDFDLHLAPEYWDDLSSRLTQASLAQGQPLPEGPSWRPRVFRRFQVGTLPDGREEWLEFWKQNHLLEPFDKLWSRREVGEYGGVSLPFLSLPDLIHSKETERATDWSDVSLLEEFWDARLFRQAADGGLSVSEALRELRSRRGFERWFSPGHWPPADEIDNAVGSAACVITQAFLLPCSPQSPLIPIAVSIEPIIEQKLRTITAGSALHFSLVEAVRRQYKTAAMAKDRADKEAASRHSM